MEHNDKMGFNHFLMFVTFQYRGLNYLDLYCTLTDLDIILLTLICFIDFIIIIKINKRKKYRK